MEPFTCNSTLYTYVIYALLLVVFIEYNLFDRKLKKINENINKKIEESIEETTQKLEKTHEDLSRSCFSRHACVIDEIESMKTDLQENKENTRMLTNINENINDIFIFESLF